MELASEKETLRFLNGLFFAWGQKIVSILCKAYDLNEEQKEELETILLKPNDWQIALKPPLTIV